MIIIQDDTSGMSGDRSRQNQNQSAGWVKRLKPRVLFYDDIVFQFDPDKRFTSASVTSFEWLTLRSCPAPLIKITFL